jgi:predicted RNA-binding protein with PUA-like domain
MPTQYWLVKQEPKAFSWDDFVREGGTQWTGIRNFQARNNLRTMKRGDLVFFYHSVSDKRVVGVAKVVKEHFPDPTASCGDWSAVELCPVRTLKTPVTLGQIKADATLKNMPLLRQSRLSTMPVTGAQAKRLLALGGVSL